MPNVVQTLGSMPLENKVFYDRTLLERLLPELVWLQFGQKKPAPKKEGDTTDFRRFNSLAPALTPLTEGVTPDGNSLSVSNIRATVQQYGDYITLSDKIDLMGIDPVLTETTQLLGEQAGLTIDTVIRDIVVAGTNVQYAGNKISRATVTKSDVLTSLEVRKVVRTFRNSKVKPIDGKYYVGLIGPYAEFDLMNDPLWVDVSKYAASSQIFDGEIGKLSGVRFIRENNTKVFAGAGASGADVHCTMFLGKGGYGVVDIEGSSKPETITKPHGSAGTADPLNQRASQGWKALFTTVRLQELANLRLEHGVTQ